MSLLTGLITQWMGICYREDDEDGSLFPCSIFQAVPPDFAKILIFAIILIFQWFFPKFSATSSVVVSPALGVPGVSHQGQFLCPRCLFLPKTVKFLVSEGL